LLFLPVFLSGCSIYNVAPPGSYTQYYSNPDKDLASVGRIAIVELNNNSSYPAISADVTKSLFQTLQKKQVFGLTIVRQSDSQWRSLQLDPDSTYTLEQLLSIQQVLKCDAVLLGSVTEYQPYPHLAIGVQLKLVDLKDGQLIWALEQIWDSADKTTAYRIKNYFQKQIRSGFAPLREQLVGVSSLRFINFVSYEVAATLQN
jgi:hypothetical protein